MLFHGTTTENLRSILNEGLTAPSYWGTEDEAFQYADGVMLSVDENELDPDYLAPNDLLIDALREQDEDDEGLAEWDASDQSWQTSLRIFGSVRYDSDIRIDDEHITTLAANHP